MTTCRPLLTILIAVMSVGLSTSSSRPMVDVDVLVVGGGVSGIPAAIQAARAGASTMLVEAGSQLGGTMTSGGVSFPGLFDAWGKQVIAGIGWDLVCETVAMDGGTLPDFTIPYGTNHPEHQITVNAPLFAALAEERCLKAGVVLRFYETPMRLRKIRNGWIVDLCGKGMARGKGSEYVRVRCRTLIDATGGATLVGMAGLPRERGEETQPGSLIFELQGYDAEALDYPLLDSLLSCAKADGRLKPIDCYASMRVLLNDHHGRAVSHVIGADSSTSESHTAANVEGRESLLRLLRVLKTFPGLENVTVKTASVETGVRETWRIKGLYQVTADDYVEGRKFEDAVAYSFYPIDLHDANGVEPRHLEEGNVPEVPFRALIPQGSKDIIVCGRSISSDRLANSALRVQATSMATGQVAGAAAALSCRLGCHVAEVPLDSLRELLESNGAIVPQD